MPAQGNALGSTPKTTKPCKGDTTLGPMILTHAQNQILRATLHQIALTPSLDEAHRDADFAIQILINAERGFPTNYTPGSPPAAPKGRHIPAQGNALGSTPKINQAL